MSEERGKDSLSKMSLSEKQRERSGSPESSLVSMRSDRSKDGGQPSFSEKTTSTKRERSGSPESSLVSMRSDHSKDGGQPSFSDKTTSTKRERSGSTESSLVSMRSDRSKDSGLPSFSEKTSSTKRERSGSPESSLVSMRSDRSKDGGQPSFSEKTSSTKRERSGSTESSLVSMRSDHSKDGGQPSFREKTTSTKSNKGQKTTVNIGAEIARWESLKVQKGMNSDVELASFLLNRIQHEKTTDFQSCRFKKFRENLIWVFQDLEQKIIVFLKNELEKFKKILKKENTQYFTQEYKDDMFSIKEAALDITLHFLKSMKQDELADTLKDELVFIHQRQLKSNLKKKYQCVFEGIAKQGDSTLLNNIYTDLYITQGDSKLANTHELRQIEISRRAESQEIQIECTNLFESPEQDKKIRTVLTKGVAGIGKSISVQKFILDWAEGKENQDISFIFPLPFREMNLKEKEKLSLMNLVSQFFPEIKRLNLTREDKFKVLFILDGLDECRLPLNFKDNETWRDVSSPASLDVLLTNLIKGNLLLSALIWITTRPAAATKIPSDCIDRVTEVRGFNDAQKEEYFRKRFTDEKMANRIIDHVKQSKSLFIMCHIPVFCWISATVLQNILEEKINNNPKNQAEDASITLQESNTEDIPKTLTQMYTHFLRFQIQQSKQKYDGEYRPDISWDKDAILSLGKLAFHQLEKNNLIFYDKDLKDCGIDDYKSSVYSGMCTQIFKEETGIIIGTMYCFVHMSIQEFIAALYAHLFLDISKKNVFVQESTEQENKNEAMIDLLKTAVDKALASDIGHLDLFLRFLLGLSLESNYPLLQGLLTQQDRNDQSNKDIVQYIKKKLGENLSAERSINLFYCLNELNDQTLVKDVQTQLREGSLSSADLSPAEWSAVAFVLLTSEEEMEVFELEKFKKSDECLIRLSAVIKASKRALLNDCNLTHKSCSALAAVLGSDSNLTELNMNNNNLQDSGVERLCTRLERVKCKLETLWLSKCDLTEESCSALASVLSSDSSILKDLDLSYNNLQDSGVKLLSAGLIKNCNCKLEKLRLSDCSITEEGYKALASALRSNPSHLIELDLTGNDPGQSGVKELSDLLQDEQCTFKTRFLKSAAAQEACEYLTKVLGKSPLLLTELDLSEDKLEDLNGEKLSALLMDSHSKVEKIKLNNFELKEKSCSVLATVLSSKTILKELNLNNSRLLDSGVKEICQGLKNPVCELKILKLSDCSISEGGYKALASALRSNPSHLIELDLTGNDPGESGVKELYDLLQDQNCQLKTLRFLSSAADEACQYVRGIVGKNPLFLRELNLSKCELGDTRVNQIAALLQDKHCKLNTLKLNNNIITAEGCGALTSAFNSNPSNLTELDLSENKVGNSGIEKICPLLENTLCRLRKLKLSDCSISEGGYKALASALRSNPSHLIELDLTGNDPGQSGVKELSDLLQDKQCTFKTRFLKSDVAQKACEYLTKVLGKSPLLLTELDLSEDKLEDLNGEKLSALLMDSHSKVEKIKLNNCERTEKSCSVLATVLSSKTILKELNLNNSRLLDSGVKEICEGLKNPVCELKILKLSDCSITEGGYKALASALRSNPSHLIELDLTGNDPGQSGVKELSDLLQDQNCQLETLRFLSPTAEEACKYVRGIVCKKPLLLRELNLSGRELGDTGVNQIAALLQDKHCKLNTLILNNNSITAEGCAALTSAFNSNPSNLRELDLSENKVGNSGIKKICVLLENPECILKKIKLSDCSITEEGYKALASALRSNPSHLIELDLTGNDPGQSGVKELDDLLQDECCTLKTIRFLKSDAAQEACEYLTKVLGKSPLLLTELDLSEDKLEDLNGEKLSALLMDSHSKVEKIKLNHCERTEKSCSVLATVLSSKTILKELNLNNSRLLDSGVKEICEGLKNPVCELKILKLSDCSITEEGYKALASALRSNPSHLIELDLTGNDPGQSGVEHLINVQNNICHSLKTLRILQSPAADEACQYVRDILGKNPLFLSDLNLSGRELGDTRVNQIAALLQDKLCEINTLMLRKCGLTEECCSALANVLRSNSSLKELDISNNNLQDSGVKKLQNGLENTNCTLAKLRLSDCSIREEGYKALASALRSNPSHLIELDLTGNDPGESGVKELDDLLQDQKCQLKTLTFLRSPTAEEACKYLTELVGKNPLLLGELNLSGHKLGDTRVNQIAALLQDKHCKLNTLILCGCSLTENQLHTLTSALFPNLSHLREMDLSGNQLKNAGAKHLSGVLKDSRCKLERLRLCKCSIKEKQCKILTSALNSNPSHLRELDLSENEPGDSGFKNLGDLLKNQQCKLEKLQLCKCSIKEKQCKILTSALNSNPSHLRELDLSENEPGDSGFKNLGDLLKNQQCKLEKLQLCKCSIKEKQCDSLASALKSNPSHLRELDLSENDLKHTRVKKFFELLKDSRCKLEILRLRSCDITAEDCSAVTLALKSNPSHLRELDLSGNKLGDSGVDNLGILLGSKQCKLEKLQLNGCGITDVSSLTQCLTNTKALQFLKQLDLSKNSIGSSEQLKDVIQNSSCNLSLEKEGGGVWETGANMLGTGANWIGGLFGPSKPQEEPVKSTTHEKPPSDESSSEGETEEEDESDHSSEMEKPDLGSEV
ncbi:uncharacterized protein LOC143700892 [Siphateles boraxobius]|uniref:uncharacterized protein LOC143700892 n=1 Tax=Siphateles boraxobius TaxID=180520 RepID=UPI0040640531